ncbi:hypothetical protein H0484_05510 [Pusillimonas sp. CC-YST705]|uniref:Uncharacterized protein n=1 Tax=Mesopusillimonas faecipullorum TaxID=2755040 RepID=A0ABS8CB18_9BURK|nr:hypothetical protein [Mesopusillimonas faecipullorum]MCB5363213.1 hypothetical protein [Mesopusillimonas faecipullorum]
MLAHGEMPGFPFWSQPQVQWSQPFTAQLWESKLHYLHFKAPWSLERTAAELAHDKLRFQVFTRLPASLLLSGYFMGQHWVAQLSADGKGSTGVISVLLPEPKALKHQSSPGELKALFRLPGHWQVLLHVRQQQEGRLVEQAIYRSAAELTASLVDMRRRLQLAGWKPETREGLQAETWQRSGRKLHWQYRQQQGQVMVFMHYSE